METIIRSALIGAITVAGAFAAFLFLRHSGWAWALLGSVAGAGAIGETAFGVATSRLRGHPIGVGQALEELLSTEPDRFFKPPTSAGGVFSGWLGVYLDLPGKDRVIWDEVAAILGDAYRRVAPKSLIAKLDAG